MKKYKINSENNPTLVIEICSFTSSGKFVFSIHNSKDNVRDILHGVPAEFIAKQNEKIYYYFFNYFNSKIQIRVSREIGFGQLSFISCDDPDPDNCI